MSYQEPINPSFLSYVWPALLTGLTLYHYQRVCQLLLWFELGPPKRVVLKSPGASECDLIRIFTEIS